MSAASKSTDWTALAREKLNSRTETAGSIGHLGYLAAQLAEIQETLQPAVTKKRLCLFAASHGVMALCRTLEKPGNSMPLEFDRLQKLLAGEAPSNILARQAAVEISLIDVGIDCDLVDPPRNDFFNRRIRRGTRSLIDQLAMTAEETALAISAGREQAVLAKKEGIQLLGVGAVGSGGVLSASALFSALMHIPPKITVGAGFDKADAEAKLNRVEMINRCLKHHAGCRSAADWLTAVGGYEIAAMAGLILEASSLRLPVVIDGFIATAAALVARCMVHSSSDICIFSHTSAEIPHSTVLALLDLRAILNLELQIDEGVGVLLAMPIIEAASSLLK